MDVAQTFAHPYITVLSYICQVVFGCFRKKYRPSKLR